MPCSPDLPSLSPHATVTALRDAHHGAPRPFRHARRAFQSRGTPYSPPMFSLHQHGGLQVAASRLQLHERLLAFLTRDPERARPALDAVWFFFARALFFFFNSLSKFVRQHDSGGRRCGLQGPSMGKTPAASARYSEVVAMIEVWALGCPAMPWVWLAWSGPCEPCGPQCCARWAETESRAHQRRAQAESACLRADRLPLDKGKMSCTRPTIRQKLPVKEPSEGSSSGAVNVVTKC